jgi:hypothetical protein
LYHVISKNQNEKQDDEIGRGLKDEKLRPGRQKWNDPDNGQGKYRY